MFFKVPRDYLILAKAVEKESFQRDGSQNWPVLDEDEFWQLASTLPNTSINTREELELGIIPFVNILYLPNKY